MINIWRSLRFKIPIVFFISFVFIFLAIFGVFSTIGRTLLEEQAYKQVTLSAQNIVATLGHQVSYAESLAISLAKLGESLPQDTQINKIIIKKILDVKGSERFIAGGGIWPEPYKYNDAIERHSFFWGRNKNGNLQYYDNYNNPSGPGYHHEEWYVPAKHLSSGKSFWSRSHMDPYSYQPIVTVSVPMFRKDQFYGVATVDLKLEGLSTVFASASAAFNGYAFAVDRNGKLLTFPNDNLAKTYSKESNSHQTVNYKTISALAKQYPGYRPLIQPVLETKYSNSQRINILQPKEHSLARDIEKESYQIDIDEAKLIAAQLIEKNKRFHSDDINHQEFYLQEDIILNEPAYASVINMPDTFWKIITVMPYSNAMGTSNVIYQNLIIYIGLAMLSSFIIMLFVVKRFLVRPISGLSKQLRSLSEQGDSISHRLESDDKGEFGHLAYWFNKRSDKLLDVQEKLCNAQDELEVRVRDRTQELENEIEHRIQQQEIKEQWAIRVEHQHAAIVDLSLHDSLFNGDIISAAKILNESAAKVLGIARTSVWLLDDTNETMEVLDLYDFNKNKHYRKGSLSVLKHPEYFKTLESDRSIAITDVLNDTKTNDIKEYAKKYNISSQLNNPIRIAGQLRGVISFEHTGKTRTWFTDEIRFGGEIADLFIQVINNSERIESEDKIRKLAFFDPLTELANRRFLQETLSREFEMSKRKNMFGSLLYLDLDNFKMLNDSLGHLVGDELLVQLSTRLKTVLRKEDMAARIGGDEFVVLLAGQHPNKNKAMKQALNVAKKIQAEINKPYRLSGFEHVITSSIGITLFPEENTTVTDILKQADTAMYRAKEEGRNTIIFYNKEFQKAADDRLRLEKELRIAITLGQFEMHYQPQVNSSGELTGTEALVRWLHPDRGLVSPLDFIPIAEETGLIIELGDWILEESCNFCQQYDLDLLAINISPRQFRQQDFIDRVRNIIKITDVNPQSLIFEVTEGVVIDNIEDTINKMNQLKLLGIRFSIDDFGTGYSSLAYLKQLPLDQLKINDKFVRDITNNSSDAIIVETIILMARHLGLKIVAEGVETEAQLAFLTNLGCQIFQGYLFNLPLSKSDFISYIQCSSTNDAPENTRSSLLK